MQENVENVLLELNLMTNLDQFLEFLSHRRIDRYVGSKKRLNSYNLGMIE